MPPQVIGAHLVPCPKPLMKSPSGRLQEAGKAGWLRLRASLYRRDVYQVSDPEDKLHHRRGSPQTLSPTPILVYFPSDIVAPRAVPAGSVTNVSLFADRSRSGVIGVTAGMPIQDFNTLFAKESLTKTCAETLGLQMCFERARPHPCQYEMKQGSRRTFYDSRNNDVARHQDPGRLHQ